MITSCGMLTAAQANEVLRRHMLFVSAPLSLEWGRSLAALTTRQPAGRGSGIIHQSQQFSRGIVVDTKNESVHHASRHLEAVEKSGSSDGAEELREALIICCSSTQRLPVPEVTLAELLRIFYEHMQCHSDDEGAISGDYILNSLSLFFVCDRQEAYHRYATPLVELGVLRSCDPYLVGQSRFETMRFSCSAPYPEDLHLLPLRELLSRFLCIFCHKSCVEGGNELIYLSHSRWMFHPRPDARDRDETLDTPFSPFPESLRRGFLGPLMQFVTSFCIADCRMHDAWGSDCCIVCLDGVKIALCLLALNNTPLNVLNPENGSLDRCDCPVSVAIGFPDNVPDSHIRSGVQRMLDVIEFREGPRVDYGVRIGQLPEEFRRWCRTIGEQLFYMVSELFFNPLSAGGTTLNLQPDWKLLMCGNCESWRKEKSDWGYSLYGPGFLNPAPRVASLSRQTFLLASELHWSFQRALAASTMVGGCFATVLLVGSQVVLSDCHPYLTSLLTIDARHGTCVGKDLQLPIGPLADDMFGGGKHSRVLSHLWGRVVCTNFRQSSLHLAWRYLSAPVVRLVHQGSEDDVSGLFYRSLTVTIGDVHLVMLLGRGRSTHVERPHEDAVWDELVRISLREMAEREHDMEELSSSVAERDTPQRPPRCGGRVEGPICIGHELTTGSPTLLGRLDGMATDDGAVWEAQLVKEIPYAQALLGNALCSQRRYGDSMVFDSFVFPTLPVTRVVLGRTAFGCYGRERGTCGAVCCHQVGGQELFFTDVKSATFRSVEESFASFMATRTGERGVKV